MVGMMVCVGGILVVWKIGIVWLRPFGATFHFSFCCHAELVSASHREPFLVFLRGQILKRVQDDGVWVVMGVWWPQVLGHVAVPRLYRRHFIHPFCSHGLKSPRLLAFGFASFRRLVFILSC